MDTTPDFLQNMDAVLKHKNVTWAKGSQPDYSTVNRLYLEERWKIPEKGSLEDMITNLMKNWEKELVHKANPAQWVTTTLEKFQLSVNGSPLKGVKELAANGNYNTFIGDTEFYCASKVNDPEKADRIFRTALPFGFAWECLQVYSGPPVVSFKWRHWGYMHGDLECPRRTGPDVKVKGHGKKVEIFGMTRMTLNDQYQILDMEHFFRPDSLLEQMVEGKTL